MRFLDSIVKNKKYYIRKDAELKEECQKEAMENNMIDPETAADILYAERAKAEHIVGHYLYHYETAALDKWKSNLQFAMARGEKESETDRKVTEILTRLCR